MRRWIPTGPAPGTIGERRAKLTTQQRVMLSMCEWAHGSCACDAALRPPSCRALEDPAAKIVADVRREVLRSLGR